MEKLPLLPADWSPDRPGASELSWRETERRKLFDAGVFGLEAVDLAIPGGALARYTHLRSSDWANVFALSPEGDLIVVEQWRSGSRKLSLESPGGAIDRGEEPLAAAKRELREETGCDAREWTALGSLNPNSSFHENRIWYFAALDCRVAGDLHLDETERLQPSRLALKDFDAMVQDGRIDHALVVAGWCRFRAFAVKRGLI